MDGPTDSHLTRGDTIQNSLAESFTVDHEHEPGSTAPSEDSVTDNLDLPSSGVHLSLVTDSGDIEGHECPIHSPKSDQQPSDIQTLVNSVDPEEGCLHPQNNSDLAILSAISKEISPSKCTVVPASKSISVQNVDSESHIIGCPQEPPLLCARTISRATAPGEEREADSDDRLTCTQMPYTKLDHVHSVGLPHLTDETREDFDYPCEDLSSSLPPNSSPPQLFPSSPYASTQSSISGVESSETVPSVEVESCASSRDCPHGDDVVSVAQDKSRLEPKSLHSHGLADVAALSETDLRTDSTSCVKGSPGPSTKRTAYQIDSESYGSQPIKRSKPDSRLYLPPTPKRATLASQHRQFKKLAAPFRPPSKLPAVMGELAQTKNNRVAESTISTTPETRQDKIDMKGHAIHLLPSQHKAVNTSKFVTQFKSPLVNRNLPVDSRTIRLTPALQTLERKLQLLKRAIKVKEGKDEEVLTRLVGKWIEAGREVAYDVWDATKGAGDFGGEATFTRRSFGWESSSSGNMPWGWDIKPGSRSEESCRLDSSPAPYGAERLVPEEDFVGCNTLGTMLRQLGIAPEIFGWDDDKETFSD